MQYSTFSTASGECVVGCHCWILEKSLESVGKRRLKALQQHLLRLSYPFLVFGRKLCVLVTALLGYDNARLELIKLILSLPLIPIVLILYCYSGAPLTPYQGSREPGFGRSQRVDTRQAYALVYIEQSHLPVQWLLNRHDLAESRTRKHDRFSFSFPTLPT